MIISVMVSVASLGFGVYKNIEAGNAKAFAYEQAYRVMDVVKNSSIGSTEKENLLASALGVLRTPPPVIDLSRSSADVTTQEQTCSDALKASCVEMAGKLASLNAQCVQNKNAGVSCSQALSTKASITKSDCFKCFTQ
jgi:hypothetical protein